MALHLPRVTQFTSDVLEVVVPHVVDAEDEAVLILRDGGSDVFEEFILLLAAPSWSPG